MLDAFKIYIDRLRDGHTEKIEHEFAPDFLDVNEPELQFETPIDVKGEAYLAEDHLILKLQARTLAKMPCRVCNKMIPVTLRVNSIYHSVSLAAITESEFDFQETLREALLLELPKYAECNNGKCLEREIIAPYMKEDSKEEAEQIYYPFKDLDKPKEK